MKFSQWWQGQPDNFAQGVIWSDKKWFVKRTPPNQQKERYWALVHPHEFEEPQNQGGGKIMVWVARVGIIDGNLLSVLV